MLPQELGDVGLERDEIRRIFAVPPDGNRAGDVTVDQAERSAEQVDAGGDDRRADAVLVEHQRADEIVDVALVVRCVDHAAGARGCLDDVEVLAQALDLPQNRIQRMLQRPVDRIALRGPQLIEVALDALACVRAAFAVAALEVSGHFLPREHSSGDVVEHVYPANIPFLVRLTNHG